jgi:hypothetical protein
MHPALDSGPAVAGPAELPKVIPSAPSSTWEGEVIEATTLTPPHTTIIVALPSNKAGYVGYNLTVPSAAHGAAVMQLLHAFLLEHVFPWTRVSWHGWLTSFLFDVKLSLGTVSDVRMPLLASLW